MRSSLRIKRSHVILVLILAMSAIVQLLFAFRVPLLWFGDAVGAGDEQLYTLQALSLIYGKDAGGWALDPYHRIRSFFYPTMLAGWFTIVRGLTGRDFPSFMTPVNPSEGLEPASQVGTWIFFTRLFNIFFSIASIFLVYELSRRLFQDNNAALTSALLLGTNWVFLFWGARSSADPLPVPFLLVSVLFMVRGVERSLHAWVYSLLAGVALGLGFMCRFQLIVVAVPILVFYFLRTRKLTWIWLGGLGLALVFQTILDNLTWGTSSVVAWFVHQFSAFSEIANGAPALTQYTYFSVVLPPYYLIAVLPFVLGAGLWLALLGFRRDWRSAILASMIVVYIAFISLSGAKALRFLLPVIPLFCLFGGLSCLVSDSKSRRWQYLLLGLSVTYGILMAALLIIYPTCVTDPLLS